MVFTPLVRPVTTPEADPTTAIAGLLLLHVPPVGEELNVVEVPSQMANVPVMALGAVFTVTTLVAKQPPASVYVIVAVPAVPPVTTPEVEFTLAVPDALLVQVPPVGVLLKVVVNPEHTVAVPVIDDGVGCTVTI